MSQSAAAPQDASQVAPQAQGQPPLTVNIQYVKDLSFEVPNAPAIYTTLRAPPRVDINLDVQARRIQEGQNVFEVTLEIRAEATEPTDAQGVAVPEGAPPTGQRVFLAEMSYSGIFTVGPVPENAVEPLILVECPRLLFPFARNLLADTTREGGFPPVLLQPIDFVQLWQTRRARAAAAAQGNGVAAA